MSNRAAPPRLLVSVRDVDEARSAIAGGADIIDVKEPDRGSLGRADAHVVRELALLPEFSARRFPLSVALGEVYETDAWNTEPLPPTVTYAKFGLARLRHEQDWIARWRTARQCHDDRSTSPLQWIAVIYADEAGAEAPTAQEIIAAATGTRCVGVLVDTYDKTGGGLLEFATVDLLSQWAGIARRHHLMFAVAGRLSLRDLPHILPVSPDVIAVRSAVCERQDRRATICKDLIAGFKRSLRNLRDEIPVHVATG